MVEKYVLISVYDKKNLSYLCKNLSNFNYKFISTGGTYKKIDKLGYKCLEVSKLTGFNEILEGRVKTLHHKIHAALLYKKDNKKHLKEVHKEKIFNIEMVVVNLYPFEKYFKKSKNINIIEMIDIGGPSLLRASGKNFQYITPIMKIEDYPHLIRNLKKNNGMTDINFRKKMAKKVFRETSKYDQIISSWFNVYKK